MTRDGKKRALFLLDFSPRSSPPAASCGDLSARAPMHDVGIQDSESDNAEHSSAFYLSSYVSFSSLPPASRQSIP